jgi:hypothetical protein
MSQFNEVRSSARGSYSHHQCRRSGILRERVPTRCSFSVGCKNWRTAGNSPGLVGNPTFSVRNRRWASMTPRPTRRQQRGKGPVRKLGQGFSFQMSSLGLLAAKTRKFALHAILWSRRRSVNKTFTAPGFAFGSTVLATWAPVPQSWGQRMGDRELQSQRVATSRN